MAGLCNRPQWYLRAAASLVAFYLTHDDSTRLHSRGTLSSAHHFSAGHRPSRTHRQHARPRPGTDMSLRRAVKASQSSFHRRSLHGRARNTPWIRKEIKSEERPTNGLPPGHAAACAASGHSFHAVRREMGKRASVLPSIPRLRGFLERSGELGHRDTFFGSKPLFSCLRSTPPVDIVRARPVDSLPRGRFETSVPVIPSVQRYLKNIPPSTMLRCDIASTRYFIVTRNTIRRR